MKRIITLKCLSEDYAIADSVTCSICHGIFRDPVRIWRDNATCDHVYCRTCITSGKEQLIVPCSSCIAVGLLKPYNLLRNAISDLEFKCPFDGCGYEDLVGMNLNGWDEHIATCEHRTEECPNTDCVSGPIPIAEFDAHLQTCPHFLSTCPYQFTGCDFKYKRNEQSKYIEHIPECAKRAESAWTSLKVTRPLVKRKENGEKKSSSSAKKPKNNKKYEVAISDNQYLLKCTTKTFNECEYFQPVIFQKGQLAVYQGWISIVLGNGKNPKWKLIRKLLKISNDHITVSLVPLGDIYCNNPAIEHAQCINQTSVLPTNLSDTNSYWLNKEMLETLQFNLYALFVRLNKMEKYKHIQSEIDKVNNVK
jgi:hypothetical protein